MIHLPYIDPVALQLGPFALRWYALTWIAGFAGAYFLVLRRALAQGWQRHQVQDLVLWYAVLGAILGGRVGYVLFYGQGQWGDDWLWPLKIWTGGMSFHGGLLGVLLAIYVYGRRHNRAFFAITDMVAPAVPLALGLVRVGNFLGGELLGRPSDVPWAVVYAQDAAGIARHPSQLYQAFCEGVVLLVLLWWYSAKPRPRAMVSAWFLIGYGVLRWFTEQFREPDAHIGFDIADWITRGQLLSLPLILAGLVLWYLAHRRAL